MTREGRAGVVGSPIEHSLSPALHLAAYNALGLNWDYGRVEVARGELATFVAELDDLWRGLSVTMPLKEEALALADSADEMARATHVANTLVRTSDGQWRAFNTDVLGIVESIRQVAPGRSFDQALILGSGATARSAIVALARLGVRRVMIAARRPEGGAAVAELAAERSMTVTVIDAHPRSINADLVVSTIPADAAAPWADVGEDFTGAVLLDVTYAPWPTTLARAWSGPVASGLDLLVHQALAQVQVMTGHAVPVEVLRAALPTYPQA